MKESDAAGLYEALRSKAELDYSWKYFWNHGAIVVSVGLQLNPTLLRLRIVGNYIAATGAAAIAEGLKLNTSLQNLNLGENRIGSAGAAAIAEAIKVNSCLQELDVGLNEIGNSGHCERTQGELETAETRSQLQQNWRFWCHGYCGSTER
jgi:Leucine Rich repeat